MMHGREKSDSAIVAGKPTNKAVPTAAEPVEPRARGRRASKARTGHRDGSACHKRWNAYGKPRKGRRRSSLRSSTTSAFLADLQTLSETSLICMSGFIGEHTGHCRHGGYTFLNRTGGSARSRSQTLRTKSSRERPLLC